MIIPFLFVTGLRIGEVVSLKYSDLDNDNNLIIINKSESVIYDIDEHGDFRYVGKKVLEHTKTDAGEHMAPYTVQAKRIISMIKSALEEYGYYDNNYIFCPKSKRISANSIDKKLYEYCDAIGISKKSAHKIRKTYISRLINSGQIDIDTICKVAGHTDMKTTFTSCCYSLDRQNELQDKFENVLQMNPRSEV